MPGDHRNAAIRVMMMPRDTNAHGTIFGGVILSHIDQAGAVALWVAILNGRFNARYPRPQSVRG